jgi:hypothetical protein
VLSPALETLVKPFFEENDFSYETSSNGNAISAMFKTPDYNLRFAVSDYTVLGILSVECWDITRFEPRDSTATQLANDLNCKYPGKFTIDNNGSLDYTFELCVTEHTVPADFAVVFQRTAAIVDKSYPTIMKARWAPKPRNGSAKRKRQDPSKNDADIARLIEQAFQQDD